MKDTWKEITVSDVLLTITLICILIVLMLIPEKHPGDKHLAVIKNNVVIAEYPLTIDGEYRIDEHNSFAIHKGQVRMTQADCPDKRCLKQGFTTQLPIICLPNRLVLEIRDSKKSKSLILQ